MRVAVVINNKTNVPIVVGANIQYVVPPGGACKFTLPGGQYISVKAGQLAEIRYRVVFPDPPDAYVKRERDAVVLTLSFMADEGLYAEAINSRGLSLVSQPKGFPIRPNK